MTVDNGAPVVTAPAAPPVEQTLSREPRSVREAREMARTEGIPIYQEAADPEPVAPTTPVVDPVDAAIDDLTAPPAGAAVPAAAPAGTPDPFAEYGGRDEVANATMLAQGMRTEQGMRLIVAQGLAALGYDPVQVRAALEAQGASPAAAAQAAAVTAPPAVDPFADVADDDVVTGAELKRIVQAAVSGAVAQTSEQMQRQLAESTKPLADQFQVERQQRSQAVVDGTLVELLGAPPADPAQMANYRALAQEVLAAAAPFVQADNWEPSHIRSAVIRGHQTFTERQETALRAYAATKAAARAAQPTHVGGTGTPGGEVAPEPKNMKEAIAMRKAQGIN